MATSVEGLEALGIAVYQRYGADADLARFLWSINLEKTLAGDDARGVTKLPGIVDALAAGRLTLTGDVEVVRERGAYALMDGGPTLWGRVVAKAAMERAIELAKVHAVGFVGYAGSAEILGPFVRLASDAGCVGIASVQSVPFVAPFGGSEPILGNAPMAIAVPRAQGDPVLLDMSLTETSASGVFLAARQGEQVPPGCLLDEEGRPTQNAADFPNWDAAAPSEKGGATARGSLLPIGGGHKGSGLLVLSNLLCALLTSTSFAWDLAYDLPERGTYGGFMMALDLGAVGDEASTMGRVDEFVDRIKGSRPGWDGREIRYPGEGSARLCRELRAAGSVEVPAADLPAVSAVARAIDFDLSRLGDGWT